jgi:cell division protein ZapA
VNDKGDGVRVEIYDQAYSMRGELDADYIRELARFVDDKMRSIAARTRTVDSLRVAILAALNIADECHQLKSQVQQVEQRIGQCSAALEELIEAPSPGRESRAPEL